MHMYRLQGSYHQIGAEYGLLLRAGRVPLPQVTRARREFARECEPYVRELMPELFDELEGIAEGGEYDPERITTAALLLNAKPGCTAVAIAGTHTASGHTIFGRNYDWFAASTRHTALCNTLPEGALSSIGSNDRLVGRFGGVNSAGVAIAIAAVEGGPDHPGVIFTLAARAVLDRCRTTAEAVDLLQSIRHMRTINFLIADVSGNIATVEAGRYAFSAIRAEQGFGMIANQFQSETMARYERVRRRPKNSTQRLVALREWFHSRTSPLTDRDVQDILSTRCPRGVCDPGKGRSAGRGNYFGTTWSWTVALGTRCFSLADGMPSQTPYRPYAFE